MFLGLCALLVVLAVPLWRGSWTRLAELRVRGASIGVAALALQVVVMTVWPSMPHVLAVSGHLLSYAALGWVLWLNRRLPGMVLVAAGTACNAVTIAVNGGTLPASPTALRAAGVHLREGFDNSGLVAHPHLGWLGDTMVTPSWLPLRNVVSIGDLLLLVGALVLVVCASRPPRRRARHAS